MSSSVFAESPVHSTSFGPADGSSTGAEASGESNLVVVYGKNGINVDRNDLQKLMDEETPISSISVVRLTSPTPSMEDAEETQVEFVRRKARRKSAGSEDDDNDESDAEEDLLATLQGTKRKEIVGVTVEEFYPPEEAQKLAKEIMKMAGVTKGVSIVDVDFLRLVIRNDHCYTSLYEVQPITKPAAERSPARSQLNKKLKKSLIEAIAEKKPEKEAGKKLQSSKYEDDEEYIEDEEEEETDYSESEDSAETDNDRDSDLDFDLNNRNGRKRRVKKKKKKMVAKGKSKLRQLSQSEHTEEETEKMPAEKKSAKLASRFMEAKAKAVGSLVSLTSGGSNRMALKTPAGKVMPSKAPAVVESEQPATEDEIQVSTPAAVQQKLIKHVHPKPAQTKQQTLLEIKQKMIQSTPMDVQQKKAQLPVPLTTASAIISTSTPVSTFTISTPTSKGNFTISTPTSKGSFTDISTLISRSDKSAVNSNLQVTEMKAEKSLPQPRSAPLPSPTLASSTGKGFMPLGIESAATNQLPAQISIQTHQSSSELAAENDKQLDLIDSIVKDELEKSNLEEDKKKEAMDESIPKLVKMLESSESAVLNVATTSATYTSPVEDIDIASASLLDEPPEDDLPESLLQHVAELMDESNLQDIINKQLDTPSLPSPPQSSIEQQPEPTDPAPQAGMVLEPRKSIIEASISNTSASADVPTVTVSKLDRKQPTQIIRGNGRIITLPPIEAPTTRAKRRAQTGPGTSAVGESPAADRSLLSTSTVSESSFSMQSESGSRRSSIEPKTPTTSKNSKKATTGKTNKGKGKKSGAAAVPVDGADEEFEEMDEDEDDPNKLWCICRQPHNNRFMICCDMCEDWFHGTCVNITKAMGREMEQRGIEWTCPECKKKKQLRITDLFEKKTIAEGTESTPSAAQPKPQSQLLVTPQTPEATVEVRRVEPFSNMKTESKTVTPIKPMTKKSIESGGVTTPQLQQRKLTDMAKKTPEATRNQKKTPASSPIITAVGGTKKPPAIRRVQVIKIQSPAATSSAPSTSPAPTSAPASSSLENHHSCIVCKKEARPNSIYCGDECIRKHATNAISSVSRFATVKGSPVTSPTSPVAPGSAEDLKNKKKKNLFEDLLSMADKKPKVERVHVFERKSGRLLTGSNAPTTANLKKWLHDNPTFEVVQPGSPQALEIEKAKHRMFKSGVTTSTPSTPVTTTGAHSHLQPQASTSKLLKLSPDQAKLIAHQHQAQQITQVTLQKAPATKVLKSYPQQVSLKSDKPVAQKPTHVLKKQSSVEKAEKSGGNSDAKSANASSASSDEPIRLNVRRTLKEQLLARMNEITDEQGFKKLTAEEIDEFSLRTEQEMFKMFNKDTGAKYKAKYRSLMFNIKDRKNETLFKKICQKEIEAQQLVRMSPEELASQELAQWRENENKHQLEMIKKSELDLLSCAKNYVLKTHKGEEVIERKETDRLSLDLTIPVEDVVTVLNNSTVSSTTEIEPITKEKEYRFESSYDFDSSFENKTKTTEVSASSSSDKKKSNKDKEREKDRDRRSKEKSRHKEKSRKRSRSRSRERKHKSSPAREGKKEKTDEKREHKHKAVIPETKKKETTVAAPTTSATAAAPPPLKAYSLIDQILESTKTVEEAANLVKEKPSSASTPTSAPTSDPASFSKTKPVDLSSADSDQEPTSTVSIATPPENPYDKYSSDIATIIWSGCINMIDVATFDIIVQPVSGVCTGLDQSLPTILDVVGRIGPDTVWDYISKIKKSPNKEIAIIRLVPANETEDLAYSALYKYLDKRKRLGVVKTTSSNIKDFYIVPLGAGKKMPTVLTPVENFEFYEDSTRPDLLLGIVIRIMSSKRHSTSTSAIAAKTRRKPTVINRSIVLDDEQSFTPPGSPKPTKAHSRSTRKTTDDIDVDAIIKAPIKAKAAPGQLPPIPPPPTITQLLPPVTTSVEDEDEPYSPGGSLEGDSYQTPPPIPSTTDDLQREMLEINREIENRKKELSGLLINQETLAPTLANISIPSNLSQILASINAQPVSTAPPQMVPPPPLIGAVPGLSKSDDTEEYNPEEATSTYEPANSGGSTSRLAQLSEAELLNLVPDSMKEVTDDQKPPPEKKPRWQDPPPPGMEDDYL